MLFNIIKNNYLKIINLFINGTLKHVELFLILVGYININLMIIIIHITI